MKPREFWGYEAYSPELPGCVALHPTSESVVITSVIIVGVVITFSFMS